MKEFYFGKNKLVMEWQGRKDRTAFLFSGLDSASGFAALPAVMGIAIFVIGMYGFYYFEL